MCRKKGSFWTGFNSPENYLFPKCSSSINSLISERPIYIFKIKNLSENINLIPQDCLSIKLLYCLSIMIECVQFLDAYWWAKIRSL